MISFFMPHLKSMALRALFDKWHRRIDLRIIRRSAR